MIRSLGKNTLVRVGVMAAFIALAFAAGLSSPGASAASAVGADEELVYVGMHERQIRALRFDAASGRLTAIGPVAEGIRSTWAVAHPALPILYAVDDDNTREGSVTAFAVDRASGALRKINEVATGGSGTTFLTLDAPSMTLLAANYGGGSTSSIALNADGSLGALVSTIKAAGSGPHRRQANPHNHGNALAPDGRHVLVPDLGADRVFIYDFDRATRALSAGDGARAFAAPAGSGPRHLAFGADGRFVYLLNELTAEVAVLRWDAQQARLAAVQTLPVSSEGFQGARSGAEIVVSRDGRYVYVEDRGENTLVAYAVDAASGTLSLVQRIGSGGERPWGFAIHPSGKWMLVANQRSGKVNVFGIDPVSGKLSETSHAAEVPTPVSLTFVK
ncbi:MULTISPECIES: lactonase family protein [unclassified Herbaspirillum]|uniref:lactonase family protein n=1 Tax=unclassified Herbaspirillum TaxID=2624150 RepID=UPI001169F257|nr:MULTISPECIES: lactonase family protein [unclassified Herbaspirillum]MBB5390452.1 6-phosphogluconolactonase [Herbaspirillum sp. SJZ102]TQK09053.1 6-phosphogluconolactonase (cycloisomerase 2 family) [Herbaspirillum sp. SJZ130]TQK14260.1 6-phosphogluconolactonase (cycloisomerase 2 family) [Herbaspirillum sp. SJZ106]